ncbi:MAG: hypothetical protein R3C04_10400 [Hyphomonas sp.]
MWSEILAMLAGGALLVNIAGLAQVCGLLIRDQLLMRSLLMAATLLYISYYFLQPVPLWSPIFWSTLVGLANLSVILRLLSERTTFNLSADEKALYRVFYNMSPGEFRRILRKATWQTPQQEAELITAGKPNSRLFYVIGSNAQVIRPNRRLTLDAGRFAGELSFLLGTPATASVIVPANTPYVYWEHKDLIQIEKRYPAIRIALREILNVDLAQKVVSDGV